jgi:formate hydrogenlyase subunit 3/multisubunit Na+/H+ antiporter MnhD subunit
LNEILLYPIFVPIIIGFILLFLPSRLRLLSKALAMPIAVAVLLLSIIIFSNASPGPSELNFTFSIVQIDNFNLDLALNAKPLGSFIMIFAALFGLLITIYSLSSGAGEKRPNIFYGSILLTIGGSAGILLSDHLLFLLIFWEIVTASLYLLISTGGKNSNFAATKSFAMIGASDAAFLLGIAMAWVLSGTFMISKMNIASSSALSIVAFLLLMIAAITKAGALPLHTWLPTSGEYAPPSVMALLPAAIDKLLGIYLLVIIVKDIFNGLILNSQLLSIILALVGSATIIVAVMIAMVQHNLKKLLSYHAISQVGYMVLGIATMTPVGIAGGIFHMLNNSIYKCCLFLCGGAVEKATGTPELDRLGGLGKKMPITFITCLIAALSISGIPPLNGFVSKWMVYQGVIQMGTESKIGGAALWPIWLTCAIFGSALTLASFVKLIHSLFLSRLPNDLNQTKEVSPVMWLPMVILAALCVLFGVCAWIPLKGFIYPAMGIYFTDPAQEIGFWTPGLATILLIVGVLLAVVIMLIARTAKNTRTVSTWICGEVQDNEDIIIPGTHFYKTVSSMGGLKQLYKGQEKGLFDPYDQSAKCGFGLTSYLKWLHCGILPVYLTWVTLGLLIVLFIICKIW